MELTLEQQRELLPGMTDAELHEFFAVAPPPLAPPSRPVATSPVAHTRAAFDADVARRTTEISEIATACQAAGRRDLVDGYISCGLSIAQVHASLASNLGWDRAFGEVHAATTAATEGPQADAAAVDSWAASLAVARGR